MSNAKRKMTIINLIRSGKYIDATIESRTLLDPLPPRDRIRDVLRKPPFEVIKRAPHRLLKVEDLGSYKVFIEIPGRKSEYDFYVWAVRFHNNVINAEIPSHDSLGEMYLNLRNKHKVLKESLFRAVLAFIKHRQQLQSVIDMYFKGLEDKLINEIKIFMLTLKWVALQEDVNYPPPQLGSLYSLVVYAVLEVIEDIRALRRVIRF